MKVNVATVSRALIQKAYDEGKSISNDDLALLVVKIFESKDVKVATTGSCIAWYKSKMRKEGKIGASASKKSIVFDVNSLDLDAELEAQDSEE